MAHSPEPSRGATAFRDDRRSSRTKKRFSKSERIPGQLPRSPLLGALPTCPYCESIDGRIIEKDDPFAQNTIFHSNCRGIWVAILKDEEELPKITGIPKSLRDRFGDAVNDLIQPKKR